MERCKQTRRSAKAEMNMAIEHWLSLPLGFIPEPTEPAESPSKKGGKGKGTSGNKSRMTPWACGTTW
jgi:hypothetical protein